jgi:hypothetical protein
MKGPLTMFEEWAGDPFSDFEKSKYYTAIRRIK